MNKNVLNTLFQIFLLICLSLFSFLAYSFKPSHIPYTDYEYELFYEQDLHVYNLCVLGIIITVLVIGLYYGYLYMTGKIKDFT